MAAAPSIFRLSRESQVSLGLYARSILDTHYRFTELRNKMEAIDIAYARYKLAQAAQGNDGVDVRATGNVECGVGFDDIIVPVVISQVDTFVGYLADVFLTGVPIFPVVSNPRNIKEAETLESIIDNHATLGGYARQFLLAFRNGIKHNFMPLAIEWEAFENYNMTSSILKPLDKAKIEKSATSFNKLSALDPYNTIWDFRCQPGDVAALGEYAGSISMISRINLKKKLAYYQNAGSGYNINSAMTYNTDKIAPGGSHGSYYRDPPQISNLVSWQSVSQYAATDWVAWLNAEKSNRIVSYRDSYEYTCLYARIIPSEHGMDNVPEPNTPQIWKLDFINTDVLIHARRIISAYDLLPILIGQPLEDGFSYQTQSIAESEIPIQQAASTLFNIRINSARRALSDRALYNPEIINPAHVNARHPSPKIPIRTNAQLGPDAIDKAYKQIPFDDTGTSSTIGDAARVMELSAMLHGANRAQQGQFQKGNKSVTEWTDTQAASNNRLRLPALGVEMQIMLPIREQMKMNIFQYGAQGTYQNYKTGESIEVTAEMLEKIRNTVRSFRIGDGYTPKSKLASTEFLLTGMQLLSASQILQATYGQKLPAMFSHLMSLGGVKDLDQYDPTPTQAPTAAPIAPVASIPPAPAGGTPNV